MAIAFLNEVWSARLLMSLNAESVFKKLTNRNYQVDANNAKKVHIGSVPTDITVSDYSVNTDISAPQTMTTNEQILTIDQQKYFHLYVDSIEEAQTKPAILVEAMRLSAIKIAGVMDTHVQGKIEAVITAGNTVDVSTGTGTNTEKGEKIIDALVDIKELMRGANISKTQAPWLVISPYHLAILEKYFASNSGNGIFVPATAEQTLRSGFSGNLLGFNTYWSNAVGEVAEADILCGINDATTHADTITELQSYKPEKRFGQAVKGLYVYGTKVTNPEWLFKIADDKA